MNPGSIIESSLINNKDISNLTILEINKPYYNEKSF